MARPSPAHGDGTDQAVAAFGGEHERLRLTGMQPRAEGGRTVFIDGTGEAEATGDLATWYESQRTAWGYLPNYAEIFASRPEVAHAWSNLNLTIRGGMDRRRFELATIAASRALRCTYCLAAHSTFLRDVVIDDVAKELRVGGAAVGAAQGARRRDRRQLEPASIHTAADREVEVAPGVGDLGPAGEDLGVVGQVSPGGALRLVPGGEVTGGLGLARPVDEHGPAPLRSRLHPGQAQPLMFPAKRGHCLVGPIAVRGARPGHVLSVRFDVLRPDSWGFTTSGGQDNVLN